MILLYLVIVEWKESTHFAELDARCMFYGSFHHEKIVFTSPSGCNETVKLSGEKKARQEKNKRRSFVFGGLSFTVLSVSLVQICSASAAPKCVLNACYRFSVPSEDRGIQGEQAWHTRLQNRMALLGSI